MYIGIRPGLIIIGPTKRKLNEKNQCNMHYTVLKKLDIMLVGWGGVQLCSKIVIPPYRVIVWMHDKRVLISCATRLPCICELAKCTAQSIYSVGFRACFRARGKLKHEMPLQCSLGRGWHCTHNLCNHLKTRVLLYHALLCLFCM